MRDGLIQVRKEQDPDRLVHVGRAFAMLGDATRAKQYFELAIQNGGDENRIVPLLIEVCIADKEYRAAIEYGKNQLRRHPEDVSLRFLLANLYGALGEFEIARDLLEEVLKAAPKDPEAHYALAVLLRDDQRDSLGADQHFRAYLRLTPKGAHSAEARGSLLKDVP